MKNKILLFTLIFISSFSIVAAGIIFPNIPVTGTTPADTTGKGNGGKLVFPTSSGVVINTVAYNSNPSADLQISGNFWLQSLSSTADLTLGWVTFDIGTVTGAPKVVLKNNLDYSTFTFSGFAWSKAAGWIYFSPNNLVALDNNTKVVYNRTTGFINGCAWSQNLGWICIDNFVLDTTPPDINTYSFSGAFAANNNKNIIIPEAVNTVSITKWDTPALNAYTTNNFNHDFRQVKGYFMKVVDTTGNIGTGTLDIVAAIPSTTLTYPITGATEASTYVSTYSSNIRGDGNDAHNINFTLRDTYGNIIKNESGIKDVKVNVTFDNNVDKNQIDDYNFGDAINYGSNDFSLSNGLISNTGTGSELDAHYNIDITSLAPTKAGYSYITGDNDIKLSSLNILIKPLGKTGVGEFNSNGLFYNDYNNKNFKFTPIVKVDTLTNNRDSNFLRDEEVIFTGSVIVDSNSNNISNLDVTHKLSTSNNFIINFQNLDITNFFRTYIGYLKPDPTNTDFDYYSIGNGIPESPISKIIKYLAGTYNNPVILNDGFKATPKIVVGGTTNFDVNYNSEISYNIGSENIKYSSFATGATNSLGNREIKIAGIAHENDKNFSVVSNTSIKYVGELDKMLVYAQIMKNATKYKNIGTSIIDGVKYVTGPMTHNLNSWPTAEGVDTIIVDGADIIIGDDILKENGKLKTIIALKNGEIGGNIWIKHNVQFIGAVLVSDRSILSGDGNVYYSDNGVINSQLFIKGSVLSYNTIGGASSAVPECPFYISGTCDEQISKRYDLNHLRSFINIVGDSVNGALYGVDMTNTGYAEAPVIVEYDPDIQTKSSKIFTTNN